MAGNWRETSLAKYGFRSTKYSASIPGPDHINAVNVRTRSACPEQLSPQNQPLPRGIRRWKETDSDSCFPSELLQLLLARLAERLVRPLLQKSQCNRFMNRWPRTTLQKQREQHNANRAYHLATHRKDHEFPVRDSQGRHINILLPVGAKPSTDYRFWTSGRLTASYPASTAALVL